MRTQTFEEFLNEEYHQRLPLSPNIALSKRYQLQQLIGQGGFGLTYMAFDIYNAAKVAIKEYFPYGNAYREETTKKIFFNKEFEENSKEKYILVENEAVILKKIAAIPVTVSFRDYFIENNTAYIVTEYFEGITLQEWIQKHEKISVKESFRLLQIQCEYQKRTRDIRRTE